MQGGVEDLRLLVEDRLRAVAVMEIHVEDGDAAARVLGQIARGDGGVVQVAEAAAEVAGGVMSWWAAQGVHAVRPGEHPVRSGQRALGGSVCRFPGPRENWAAGAEGVIAPLSGDARRRRPLAASEGEGPRNDRFLVSQPGRVRLVGSLQVADEVRSVHRQEGIQPVIFWRQDGAERGRAHGLQEDLRPRRQFLDDERLPIEGDVLRRVQGVFGGVDGLHGGSFENSESEAAPE